MDVPIDGVWNYGYIWPMKVAITVFFNAPHGGLHDNVFDTVENLIAHGHRVTVFCPSGPFQEQLTEAGCQVYDLDTPIDDNWDFDLVHAHPGKSRELAQIIRQKLNIPLIMTIHGAWIDSIQTYADQCETVLTVSEAAKNKVLSFAPSANVEVMPNAIDVSRIPAALYSNTTGFRVLVASRFDIDKTKLVETIVTLWEAQASKGNSSIRWEMAGSGTKLDELKEASDRIFSSHTPITFHGWVDKPDLADLFDSSDIAVAPGRSAIEAMARGKPVIPLGSAGCFGLVTEARFKDAAYSNFGGFGVTDVTAETIINDLIALASDPDKRSALGRMSRQFVLDNLDLRVHHARLEQIYSAAIQSRQMHKTLPVTRLEHAA